MLIVYTIIKVFSSIFLIFERLNTGGTLLQPQEIRSALYHGLFNDLLIELNANTAWRSLYGPRSKRKRDEELILRFFALFFALDKYERPLKIFLNRFMNRNKNLKIFNRESLTTLFFSTIDFIYQTFGKQAFRLIDTFNAALYDSLTVAISKNLERFRILDKKYLQKKFDDLKSDENFIRVITTATSDQENVITRIELACKYLK